MRHKRLICQLVVQNTINISKFWKINNNQSMLIRQTLELIRVILNQNYFQYKDKYFKPTKGIAMGSLISSTLAKIHLQFFKEPTSDNGCRMQTYTIEDM
jgi:hypothetical protein